MFNTDSSKTESWKYVFCIESIIHIHDITGLSMLYYGVSCQSYGNTTTRADAGWFMSKMTINFFLPFDLIFWQPVHVKSKHQLNMLNDTKVHSTFLFWWTVVRDCGWWVMHKSMQLLLGPVSPLVLRGNWFGHLCYSWTNLVHYSMSMCMACMVIGQCNWLVSSISALLGTDGNSGLATVSH